MYLDVHTIEGGVSASDVAEAHMKDVETQGPHGVNYKAYWVDEKAGKIFCLVEAPNEKRRIPCTVKPTASSLRRSTR